MAFYSRKEKQTKVVESTAIDTTIGVETSMEGNINSNGIIKVEGRYTGNILAKTDVIIGETGFVKGDIKASNTSISGTVEGNIRCSELLEILPTGKLVGDIEVNSIAISEGAIFRGKSTMLREQEEENEIIDETKIDETQTEIEEIEIDNIEENIEEVNS
ncbi:polymer-forming cytoskeletal protein [Clostridium aestuarii]|uniref:Polymer-forming cytoskeletal protein n=1 Tax=Clostridium aestuarii TaxID=338193 RepID=A0ABT4D5K5_9CLOT|nr:polymer-forming cytoskeletal protein [Clostridium aestuarii]MCY6485318.1 polymer-forming cytoskeletal protein [Clostridium aestuarii]